MMTSRRPSNDLRSAYQATVRGLAPQKPAPRGSRKPWLTRGIVRVALAAVLVLAIAAGATLWTVYRASQQVPEFYVQALAAPPSRQAAAGEELERQALALNNQVRRPGQWEARFTQDQINGWLAADLPRKFPGSLPRGAADPRVAVSPEEVQLAVKWQQGNVNAVLSAAGEVYLTEEPNEVAVRILSVRAGALPVPLARFLDEIASRAASSGLALRWSEIDGDPVALVKLPLDRAEFKGKRLVLEELRLEEGAIIVAGRTDDGTLMTTAPAIGG
jgi:hypothetical protein